MYQLGLTSVDSSAWSSGERFGSSFWFDNAMHVLNIKRYLKNKKPFPSVIYDICRKSNLKLEDFLKKENMVGAQNIPSFLAIVAYVAFQKFSQKRGLKLFLAVSNIGQLRRIIYVADHWNNWNYYDFKKIK